MDSREVKASNNIIFVFGSNLAGRHGKGAALDARRLYGAEWGVGVGRTGNAYAIPTKDLNLYTLPLTSIQAHVDFFIVYARAHPELTFEVTRVGCGLAGYKDLDIAPMFRMAPGNCKLPEAWTRILSGELEEEKPWLGCQECDVIFKCHDGYEPCIRNKRRYYPMLLPKFNKGCLLVHVKAKKYYSVLDTPINVKLESSGKPAYAYKELGGNTIWVREQNEMEDGRFQIAHSIEEPNHE